MIQSAAPIAIGTAVLTEDLAALFPQFGPMGEVKLINASPNPLQVSIGADTHWLDSWGADIFCLKGTTIIVATPSIIATPAPSLTSVASLLVTVATYPQEIPGTYPATVDRGSTPPAIQQTPWLFPNQLPFFHDDAGVGNGTGIVMVSAVGGQTVRLFKFHIVGQCPAGPAVHVRTTPGHVVLATLGVPLIQGTTPFPFQDDFDFGGLALPVGQGADVINASGGSINWGVTLTYSQN